MPVVKDESGDAFLVEDFDGTPGAEGLTKAEVRNISRLREKRDLAKAAADRAEQEYRAEEARLWEKMENSGDTSVTKDFDGVRVQIGRRNTVYSKILDQDVLLDSLEQEGRTDEMTKPGFEKRRLNEFVRECLEQGRQLPEGLDFYERRYLTITEKG